MRQVLKELVTKKEFFQQCVVMSSMISVNKEDKGNARKDKGNGRKNKGWDNNLLSKEKVNTKDTL